MGKLRVIHAADLHLGAGRDRARREERFDVFRSLLELCRETQADLLLLAGDILEQGQISAEELSRVRTLLADLSIPIFLTPGNHDPADLLSPYRQAWPEHIHILVDPETIALEQLGVSVSGAGFRNLYQRTELLPALIESYESAKARGELDNCPLALALIHAELPAGSGLYNDLSAADLARSPFNYVALGHIHQPDRNIRVAGACRYAYAGTPQGLNRLDEGSRGCFVLEFQDARWQEARFVALARTEYRNLEVSLNAPLDHEQAIAEILNQIPSTDPIWYLTLTGENGGSYVPDTELLSQRLKDEGYQLSGLLDRTAPHIDHEGLRAEDSLRGLFYRRLSRSDDGLAAEALRLGLDAFRSDQV